MKIRDQFELPRETGERREALKRSVEKWINHPSNHRDEEEIFHSLRSREDIICDRPSPVSSIEELLDSPHCYRIAFKYEKEIDDLLNL